MGVASEQARTKAIKAAREAADGKANAERVRLSWKSGDVMATVVEVPLNAVVLNPRSHRIRAQLESSSKRELIGRDPYSDEAQEEIANLLRAADRFDELRDNLKDAGQADPGVVTHTGLLVNANTRCVALRDLEQRYIRVAVLPEDANEEEIDRLELRLQMKRDFTSDYTFTNELLFIEDLVKKYRYQPNQIAVEMGWASKNDRGEVKKAAERVQQYLRMLAFIREVQDMSGGGIRLTWFDGNRQAILELDDEYERLKKRTPDVAKEIRDTRLMALLTGAGYRELREIDENFIEKYLFPSMEDQPELRGNVERVMRPSPPGGEQEPVPGLDVLEPDGAQNGADGTVASVEPLLSRLAESAGKDNIIIAVESGPAVQIPRAGFVAELKRAVESAAEDARIERTEGNLVDRPRLLLRRAAKHVRSAMEAYRQASTRENFDDSSVRKAAADLGKAHESLVRLMDGKAD